MVNGVDIAVGGVAGATFGLIFDGITEVLVNADEFTTSHTNIKSTLEALQPLMQEIEGKNKKLLLQDEELKDLKEEMEAGVKRVKELSKASYCMRPFYNMELDGMDKSLERLLRILQVQGVRDIKEVLVQVNDCKTDVNNISIQLDDCKTDVKKISIQLDDFKTEIIEEISAWKGKTTDQLDQVASNGEEALNLTKRVLDQVERINGPSCSISVSQKVASLVEEEALGSSLLTLCRSVDEALSKPNPHFVTLEEIQGSTRILLDTFEAYAKNCMLEMGFDVEEGTQLIRKCSNVVMWTDHEKVKYANKLDYLKKSLEAVAQHLKGTNSTKGI